MYAKQISYGNLKILFYRIPLLTAKQNSRTKTETRKHNKIRKYAQNNSK